MRMGSSARVTVSQESAGKLWVVVRVSFFFALLSALSVALAQNSDVQVTLGFSGEVVANTWNPLRISLRDRSAAEFVLEIDQGNLRDGEQLVSYRAPLAGGSGLYVFEDDLYIPAWRRLTWAVRTQDSVLASGSIDRRRVDPRPLHLLGMGVNLPPDALAREARVVDVRADTLPGRPSAYAGVATLWVGGEASARTVAAAAAAGTSVRLLEPLTGDLRGLARREVQRLGSGWLERVGEGAEVSPLPTIERNALQSALISPDLQRGPPSMPQQVVLLGASLYALAALLVVRFGRVPGLIAGLSLALLFAAGAWGYLRPADATLTRSRSVTLASGGLAQTLELRTLFSLPEGTRRLDVNAYPLELTSWRASPGSLRFDMPRWSAVTLVLAPRFETATFYWEGDALVNSGSAPLGDVFVVGFGQQGDIAADANASPCGCATACPLRPTARSCRTSRAAVRSRAAAVTSTSPLPSASESARGDALDEGVGEGVGELTDEPTGPAQKRSGADGGTARYCAEAGL